MESTVWISDHPRLGWCPGRIEQLDSDGKYVVIDEHGEVFNIAQKDAIIVHESCLKGVNDLLTLTDFNEGALLHNIRIRYFDDNIYTKIGLPILISVNPYRPLPHLYSSKMQKEFRNLSAEKAAGKEVEQPAHLFSVADSAYVSMMQDGTNQSMIISGESGAGKTEATKKILLYLANIHGENKTSEQSIEEQVLRSNPILEAFGNAKTIRNDNSSRFGKFIEIEFDNQGHLQSARISSYLLERCRIISQQPQERNYHIFYQLCAQECDQELRELLQLEPAECYERIATCCDIANVDDDYEFREVLECMKSLRFRREEILEIFSLVAGILHLGNLDFETYAESSGEEGACITNDENGIGKVLELLSLDKRDLKKTFRYKTFEDPMSKKPLNMPQTGESASFTRHAMAKVIYVRLFDWLVSRINESMMKRETRKKNMRRPASVVLTSPSPRVSPRASPRDTFYDNMPGSSQRGSPNPKIGLLDIYGFEVFEENSFEQLCINFANEKLQQHFNSHMFRLEQKFYTEENINWKHIEWKDNQDIIDCLDKRAQGVFNILDSECMMPSSTDVSFLSKLHTQFKSSLIVTKASRFASTTFKVEHYAGPVVYDVNSFLEKNTDKLHGDITNLLKTSKNKLLAELFTNPKFTGEEGSNNNTTQSTGTSLLRRSTTGLGGLYAGAGGGVRSKKLQTMTVSVSVAFRQQLDLLVADLNKTHPRYIRCIKPNALKAPGVFDSIDVQRQLRCAGMLESIRIRRLGFGVRRPFREFFFRYKIISPANISASIAETRDFKPFCQKFLGWVTEKFKKQGEIQHYETNMLLWQIGRSKVFMKEELQTLLDTLISKEIQVYCLKIQKMYRGCLVRRVYLEKRRCTIKLQSITRMWICLRKKKEMLAKLRVAVLVQSCYRRHVRQREFMRVFTSAVLIQKVIRGKLTRRRVGRLKSKAAQDRIRQIQLEEEKKIRLQEQEDETKRKEEELREQQILQEQQMELERQRLREEEAAKKKALEEEESRLALVRKEEEARREKERAVEEQRLRELAERERCFAVEKEELGREKEDLKEKNLVLEKDRCSLLEIKENLSNQSEILSRDNNNLSREKDALSRENLNLIKAKEQLVVENANILHEKEDLLSENEKLALEIRKSAELKTYAEEQLEIVENEKTRLEKEKLEVEKISKSNSVIAEETIDMLNHEIQTLKREKEKLQSEAGETKEIQSEEIKKMQGVVFETKEALQQAVLNYEAEKQELLRGKEELQFDLTKLQTSNDWLKEEKKKLTEECKLGRQEKARLECDLEVSNSKMETLKRRIKDVDELKNESNDLRQEVAEKDMELQRVQIRKEHLEKQIEAMRNETHEEREKQKSHLKSKLIPVLAKDENGCIFDPSGTIHDPLSLDILSKYSDVKNLVEGDRPDVGVNSNNNRSTLVNERNMFERLKIAYEEEEADELRDGAVSPLQVPKCPNSPGLIKKEMSEAALGEISKLRLQIVTCGVKIEDLEQQLQLKTGESENLLGEIMQLKLDLEQKEDMAVWGNSKSSVQLTDLIERAERAEREKDYQMEKGSELQSKVREMTIERELLKERVIQTEKERDRLIEDKERLQETMLHQRQMLENVAESKKVPELETIIKKLHHALQEKEREIIDLKQLTKDMNEQMFKMTDARKEELKLKNEATRNAKRLAEELKNVADERHKKQMELNACNDSISGLTASKKFYMEKCEKLSKDVQEMERNNRLLLARDDISSAKHDLLQTENESLREKIFSGTRPENYTTQSQMLASSLQYRNITPSHRSCSPRPKIGSESTHSRTPSD